VRCRIFAIHYALGYYGWLRKIIAMLNEERISCEVLVDGSYLTEEIQPDDIDSALLSHRSL